MTETPLTARLRSRGGPGDLAAYERAGGYRAAERALREMSPEEVQAVVRASGLRGRGGAGFPTGQKWSIVPMGPEAPRPKYLVANADEMEPGAFKDRLLLEGDPHQLIEGMIVSAYALQAEVGFIFLRWEYRRAAALLARAIEEAYAAGWLGPNLRGSGFRFDLFLHTSAGRYLCGEETALLNSLEGRRVTPRAKPPFPQTCGLWGKPTIVQNVETLCNVPHIVDRGAAWFKGLSRTEDGGTKIYGASGKLRRPGAWELPMGTSAREILYEHAGGLRDGLRLRGFLPGGASTAFLGPDALDVPLDYSSVQKAGSRLGTGTLIVVDEATCPVGVLRNLESFFARESCGWCTPCREGLPRVARILEAIERGEGNPEDLDTLEQQARFLGPGFTYCALAPGAAEPLASGLRLFREIFEDHVARRRCPWRA